jgi:salicylate hydroxylase
MKRSSMMRASLRYIAWIFVFCMTWHRCDALSMMATQAPTPRPVQRVAIIGAGISGLAVAHALAYQHHQVDSTSSSTTPSPMHISLYDSRARLDTTAGAGVQLNGGLVALQRMSPLAYEAVWQAGLPVVGIQSQVQKNEGTTNDYETILQLDLHQIISQSATARQTLMQGDRLLWVAIMRGALQQVLLETLPDAVQESLQCNKRLVQIAPSSSSNNNKDDNNGGVECTFSDDTVDGPFDLVIGCDGVHSVCKEYIETGRIANSSQDAASVALYSGIRIRYAVADGTDATTRTQPVRLTQSFGKGAYGLHGTYGAGAGQPPTQCSFLIELDEAFVGPWAKPNRESRRRSPVGENADWLQDVRQREQLAARDIMTQRVQSAALPTMDLLPTIAQANRFFDLGVYFHNPFHKGWSAPVPGSSGTHVVLCGDAAHALPPFLGQGANQALQDAYSLSRAILSYNAALSQPNASQSSVDLMTYLKQYERLRWPACFNIFWKSTILGYLETGGEQGLYAPFRNWFFRTLAKLGIPEKVLLSAAVPTIE